MSRKEQTERFWGDGKGFSPQGVDFFLDRRRSWKRKQEIVAESSACPRPKRHRRQMMKRYHTRDTEKAAKYALIEDMRQNHLYTSMVDMARANRKKRLLRDITKTVHSCEVFSDYEPGAVSEMYIRGKARGFANDDAYSIIKLISDIWWLEISQEEKRNRVPRLLNSLETCIKSSSSLAELKQKFLKSAKRSKMVNCP